MVADPGPLLKFWWKSVDIMASATTGVRADGESGDLLDEIILTSRCIKED
jgi:hypothetical protein